MLVDRLARGQAILSVTIAVTFSYDDMALNFESHSEALHYTCMWRMISVRTKGPIGLGFRA